MTTFNYSAVSHKQERQRLNFQVTGSLGRVRGLLDYLRSMPDLDGTVIMALQQAHAAVQQAIQAEQEAYAAFKQDRQPNKESVE